MPEALKLERRAKAIRDAENAKALLAGATQQAIQNEQFLRSRVDHLEAWAQWFHNMTLRQRLTWLLFGGKSGE